MNKVIITLTFLSAFLHFNCTSANKSGTKKYKARLEISGICSNYTFSVVEGDMDTTYVVPNWTDPNTGKSYQNVFAVKNPCLLPAGLKEGDVFDFVIDTSPPKNECIVCMAFYPVPPKSLDIKVVD